MEHVLRKYEFCTVAQLRLGLLVYEMNSCFIW
jgi:hypothetical protein